MKSVRLQQLEALRDLKKLHLDMLRILNVTKQAASIISPEKGIK